jgi:hypothetical protein
MDYDCLSGAMGTAYPSWLGKILFKTAFCFLEFRFATFFGEHSIIHDIEK